MNQNILFYVDFFKLWNDWAFDMSLDLGWGIWAATGSNVFSGEFGIYIWRGGGDQIHYGSTVEDEHIKLVLRFIHTFQVNI